MLQFETLQDAGRRAKFERAKRGAPQPGHMRTRERSLEKQNLLIQAVKDVYRRTPPRTEIVGGREALILPWII